MKPHSPKEIVAGGYDACASRYGAGRSRRVIPELAALIELLPSHAVVLDLGCGAGVPATAALASAAAHVIGVDISPAQLDQARANVPRASFVLGDIGTVAFRARSFDAVVSFYTLFHLPREEHRGLLERVAAWLRPGGTLLVTLAHTSHPGYTEPDFFGVTMYWSHYHAPWYAAVLRGLGFDLLAEGVLGHGYSDECGPSPERHPFILARRGP